MKGGKRMMDLVEEEDKKKGLRWQGVDYHSLNDA